MKTNRQSIFRASRLGLGVLTLLATIHFNLSTIAQVTAFTYQGRLNDAKNPVNGFYDLQFTLYVAATGSGSVAGPTTRPATIISNGLFTVTLDFGASAFPGFDRWLEIAVRTNGSGPFTTLSPRQELTPTPYAITAENLLSGGLFGNPVTFNNPNNSFSGNGGGLTNVNATTLGGFGYCALPCYWNLGGNSGTTPGTQFLGTADNQPLTLKVNNSVALRIDPAAFGPNMVAGLAAIRPTVITTGVRGAVVAGGGAPAGPVTGFGGGDFFAIYDSDCTIGGGFGNKVGNGNTDVNDAPFGTVGGGVFNGAANYASTVAGGDGNLAGGVRAAIGGGASNQALSDNSTVGGGANNIVATNSPASFIGGGLQNTIRTGATESTIGGGQGNSAGGAVTNTSITGATVSGGVSNRADCAYSFVGGGKNNIVNDQFLFSFSPPSPFAVIAGGEANTISSDGYTPGDHSAIGGGFGNQLQGGTQSVIAGGGNNQLGGNWSTIPGGQYNMVSGNYSFAAGQNARTFNNGTFIWSDSTAGTFSSSGDNQFCIRAQGGIQVDGGTSMFFGTTTRQMLNLWGSPYGIGVQSSTEYFRSASDFCWFKGGVHNNAQHNPGGGTEMMRLDGSGNLNISGAFGSLSDRNAKEHFEPVNPHEVLEKVAALPVSTWNYKTDPASRHLGPMAQDFYSAFGLGADDKHITTVDVSGVALAAIQGLNQKIEDQDQEIQILKQQNNSLEQRLSQMKDMLKQLTNLK
jgi:hypothetical protein